jgi:hypothetical protein
MEPRAAILRPPTANDQRVVVLGLVVSVRTETDCTEIQARIDGDPHYAGLVWNAGLRSRRPDGHGYVLAGGEGLDGYEVPVNGGDSLVYDTSYDGNLSCIDQSSSADSWADYPRDMEDVWEFDPEHAYGHLELLESAVRFRLDARRGWGPSWFRRDPDDAAQRRAQRLSRRLTLMTGPVPDGVGVAGIHLTHEAAAWLSAHGVVDLSPRTVPETWVAVTRDEVPDLPGVQTGDSSVFEYDSETRMTEPIRYANPLLWDLPDWIAAGG